MRVHRTVDDIPFGEDASDLPPDFRAESHAFWYCIVDGIPRDCGELEPVVHSLVPELDHASLGAAIRAGVDLARQAETMQK